MFILRYFAYDDQEFKKDTVEDKIGLIGHSDYEDFSQADLKNNESIVEFEQQGKGSLNNRLSEKMIANK